MLRIIFKTTIFFSHVFLLVHIKNCDPASTFFRHWFRVQKPYFCAKKGWKFNKLIYSNTHEQSNTCPKQWHNQHYYIWGPTFIHSLSICREYYEQLFSTQWRSTVNQKLSIFLWILLWERFFVYFWIEF